MLNTIKSQVAKSLLTVVKFLWIIYDWHINICDFEQNSFDGAWHVISYKTFNETTAFIPFEKNVILCKKWWDELDTSPNWKTLICKNCRERRLFMVYEWLHWKIEKAETVRVTVRPSPLLKITSENFEIFQGDPRQSSVLVVGGRLLQQQK